MRSTTSTSVIAAAILSASTMALGNPIISRAAALTCNVPPTASVVDTGAPPVLASPAATTAAECQEQCEANSACECFAFGLPPPALTAPTCRLFSVPAAQVPAQSTDINVFDKAWTDVPTVALAPSAPTGGGGTGNDTPQGGDQGEEQGQV
ncbi:hypothetical protein C8A01DRAFT_35416 [Parachaetomium inaequale]|uniref:Apple domain-containing protein n=1 Tax=Parachaetomium inaequale TaxID=2588326 RepID=A0AAN6PGH0_9PEZI|nr:hypothetical protein C8A01DRAFT_35416 [Parachaetomium inaequale]